MDHESVAQMSKRQRDHKASGVKHSPLHTLQECCEEAGVTPQWFGRYAAQDPDAPQVVLHHAKAAWKAGKKYYRKHEFVQWVNKVRQQKEKAMPDIKTALEKALAQTATAWAADDEAHQQVQPQQIEPQQIEPQQEKTVTTTTPNAVPNASRTTFEFIRDNPGLTNAQVTARLAAQGFKEKTVSSLAYQMLRVRLVVADEAGRLTAVVREYVPIQTSSQRKKKAKPKAKPQAVSVPETIKVSVRDPAPVVAVVPAPEWTPNDVINKLTLPQAMALFKALRNILVG